MPTLLKLLKNRDDSGVIIERINHHPDEINGYDEYGVFPLFIAAAEGRIAVVRALLDASADKDQVKNTGATSLLVAAQNGHLKVVQALLGAGANIDQAMHHGATPLFAAAQNGHIKVVQALLGAGADIEQAMDDGVTALFLAAQNGHVDVVRALLHAGANIEQVKSDGATALLLAAQKGHIDVVQALLDAGADKNQATHDGATPLYIAAQEGHIDVVRFLLRFGANIRLTWSERTPLEQAVRNGHKEIVKLLAQHPDTTCRMLAQLIHGPFLYDVKETLQKCLDERMKLAGEAGLLDDWPKSSTDTPIINPSEDEAVENRHIINGKLDTLEHLYQVFGASCELNNIETILPHVLAVIPGKVKKNILRDDFHLNRKAEMVARQITNEIEAILGPPISYSTEKPIAQTAAPCLLEPPISDPTLEFNEIKPLFTVNEANLSTIIAKLESQNTGESLFACALLLLGYIENDVNYRVREAEQRYQTQRIVSAIDFLDKAAKAAPKYTGIIRHLLWELKEAVAYDNPCVRACLARYDVKPLPGLAGGYGTFFRAGGSEVTFPFVPRLPSVIPERSTEHDSGDPSLRSG